MAIAAAATSDDWVGIPGRETCGASEAEDGILRKGAEGDREGCGPGVGVADADPGVEAECAGLLPW